VKAQRSGAATMGRIRPRITQIMPRFLFYEPLPCFLLNCTCLTPGENVAIKRMDKLDEIFSLQDDLNKRIGVNTSGMSEKEKAEWVLNYTRAMQQEIAELIDSVPWKWWAKYQKFDEQNAKVEVVDLFHFLISIAQVLGMTPQDVYDAYQKKNKVNHLRQDSGYAVKDEDDSKHI